VTRNGGGGCLQEENTYQCHESYIFHLEASRTSQLLLTSATWRSPQSAVWSIGKVFEQK
jgi:HIV-1 Vpr-binding protein